MGMWRGSTNRIREIRKQNELNCLGDYPAPRRRERVPRYSMKWSIGNKKGSNIRQKDRDTRAMNDDGGYGARERKNPKQLSMG
jgi:hypothetical protein